MRGRFEQRNSNVVAEGERKGEEQRDEDQWQKRSQAPGSKTKLTTGFIMTGPTAKTPANEPRREDVPDSKNALELAKLEDELKEAIREEEEERRQQ